MPIEVKQTVRPLDQQQFGQIAFEVMQHAFTIHDELGRFFDEQAYQAELWHRLERRASTEVWIKAKHADFCKTYFIDLLVDGSALFELKTVEQLTHAHRNQLLNYLLLTGTQHGKLINFRPERVEHEFLNTSLTVQDRIDFRTEEKDWDCSLATSSDFRNLLVEILHDWGMCLDFHLYEEAIVHFFGGADAVCQQIDIIHEERQLGTQRVRLLDGQTTFKITAFPGDVDLFEEHARRFLKHTSLKHILWANVALHRVTFRTISK